MIVKQCQNGIIMEYRLLSLLGFKTYIILRKKILYLEAQVQCKSSEICLDMSENQETTVQLGIILLNSLLMKKSKLKTSVVFLSGFNPLVYVVKRVENIPKLNIF